ncbi:MAG: hypothetical protein EBS07_04140 [Sphingobacteriia bacterium]|nr:hypothetical protein [Sphingobacteriia bacterium]
MQSLATKLNYKPCPEIYLLNIPDNLSSQILEQFPDSIINTEFVSGHKIHFLLAFVQEQKQLDNIIHECIPELFQDAICWFAYPKKSSKNLISEINRDMGWDLIATYKLEAVRAISIDSDWSALRFRKVEYIKQLKRNNLAIKSPEGKLKISQQNPDKS